MERNIYNFDFSFDEELSVTSTTPILIIAVFWASIALEWVGVSVPAVRIVAGTCFLLFVPGIVLVRLIGIGTESLGEFAVFSVGLSLAVLSAAAPVVARFLSLLGVDAPLSVLPIAIALTVFSFVSMGFSRYHGAAKRRFAFRINGPFSVLLLLFSLPTIAALGAILMSRFQINAGMFVFVLAAELVVLLAATRYLPANFHPIAVFFVSLSMLLHRNLVTDHVVGADIQITYYVADLLLQAQSWSPQLGGSLLAVPMVTSVPAILATVTGLDLTTVFTVIYVSLFALVPVTLYYLYEDVFGESVALFGSLFFVVYHLSFYFTPGKQLLSELFLALLLLLFFRYGFEAVERKLAAALLTVGLVHSHYGTTYAFGLSLLVAAGGLLFVRRFVGETSSDVRLAYPIVLIGGATAWYAYASDELIAYLWTVPDSLAAQIVALIAGEGIFAEGTGADTVREQSVLLQEINLYLYVFFSVLIVAGLTWRCLTTLARIRRGEDPEDAELTALAVPLLVFLAASYAVIPNLWVERVYQMVLPLLAPFLPLGYSLVAGGVDDVRTKLGQRTRLLPRWSLLALLLAALLAFNTGMVFALAGGAAPYTFDSEAQDYAFSRAELDGASWLKDRAPVERADDDQSGDVVRIYTDTYSKQMLRSVLPPGYFDSEVILLKSEWQPRFDRGRIGDGYVFVRERGVVDGADGDTGSVATLSDENVNEITRSGDVVYTNGDVRIVRTENGTNETSSRLKRSSQISSASSDTSPYPFDSAHRIHEYDVRSGVDSARLVRPRDVQPG